MYRTVLHRDIVVQDHDITVYVRVDITGPCKDKVYCIAHHAHALCGYCDVNEQGDITDLSRELPRPQGLAPVL